MDDRVINALETRRRGGQVDLNNVITEEELKACRKAAKALTADRTTKSLPVIVAQTIFASSFAISYYQTFSAPLGPGNWWTIEIHSIGMCHKHPRKHLLTAYSFFFTRYLGNTCRLFCIIDRRLTNENFNAQHPR
jgi:hypothetical protein